jgi:hypothetical protein
MFNEKDDTVKKWNGRRQVVAKSNVLKLNVDAGGLKVAEHGGSAGQNYVASFCKLWANVSRSASCTQASGM